MHRTQNNLKPGKECRTPSQPTLIEKKACTARLLKQDVLLSVITLPRLESGVNRKAQTCGVKVYKEVTYESKFADGQSIYDERVTYSAISGRKKQCKQDVNAFSDVDCAAQV